MFNHKKFVLITWLGNESKNNKNKGKGVSRRDIVANTLNGFYLEILP